MPIPAFDDLGLLPAGVHDATFSEIERTFCWNSRRIELWDHFQRFLNDKCQEFLIADVPFWIDGSFVRRKETPSDIDVVIDLASHTSRKDLLVSALLMRFEHDNIKTEYRVDIWLKHPENPNDLSSFFQYAGDKCAAELQIDVKHPKGILRARS